jgi:hypothetical protein
MTYQQHNVGHRLPDKARLGLGTLDLLSQIQSVERGSVDALVARAVAMYYQQHPQRKHLKQEQQKVGDMNGREKGNTTH